MRRLTTPLLALFLASGILSAKELRMSGGAIQIEFKKGPFDLPENNLIDWVHTSARAVSAYFGKFPVHRLDIHVKGYPGHGIRGGTTLGTGQSRGLIKISVGRSTSMKTLQKDWMLTHEMVHLAFPTVDDTHHWIEEGLATYVEPWARVQIGNLTREQAWKDLIHDLPQGLPREGDEGLDHTHTWARTYWGGALFFFLADVQIRDKTENKKGLEDALRAINAKTNIGESRKLIEVLKIGDQEVGFPILEDLYQKMEGAPMPIDLNALWKKLGVGVEGGNIRFDDFAPLASIRHGIDKSL